MQIDQRKHKEKYATTYVVSPGSKDSKDVIFIHKDGSDHIEVESCGKCTVDHREGDRRIPLKVGDEACVPAISGHISMLKSFGTITFIDEQYATVLIIYGRQRGKWRGAVSELSRRGRYKKDRRIKNPKMGKIHE